MKVAIDEISGLPMGSEINNYSTWQPKPVKKGKACWNNEENKYLKFIYKKIKENHENK